MGVFKANGPLHPPAPPALLHSQERNFQRRHAARWTSVDLSGPLWSSVDPLRTSVDSVDLCAPSLRRAGTFCFIVYSPRDVDCVRATTTTPRPLLALQHTELDKHFLPFFKKNCHFVVLSPRARTPPAGPRAQVHPACTGTPRPPEQEHREQRPDSLFLLLISTWSRKCGSVGIGLFNDLRGWI